MINQAVLQCRSVAVLAAFILMAICSTAQEISQSRDMKGVIEEQILKETTEHAKVADKLMAVILDNQAKNDDKIKAVKALTVLKTDAAIGKLVHHIDYKLVLDIGKSYYYPCAGALVGVGEPAVEPLLTLIEKSDDTDKIFQAVNVIAKIKGRKYESFVQQNQAKWSVKMYKAMTDLAVSH